MSDKLLAQQASRHKLPGTYFGIEDVLEHKKIIEARPEAKRVKEWGRRHHRRGLTYKENPDGSFAINIWAGPAGIRLKREWVDIQNPARALMDRRASKMMDKRPSIEVRDRAGRRKRITAQNEPEFGRRGLLKPLATTFTSPYGVPRCQLPGERHEYRNRRCWWCGHEKEKGALNGCCEYT